MGIGSLEYGNLFWKQWKMVIVSLSDELYINCILCSRSARCLILGFFSFLNKWYVYLFIFGCAKSHLLCVHRPFSGCVKQQLLCSCNVWACFSLLQRKWKSDNRDQKLREEIRRTKPGTSGFAKKRSIILTKRKKQSGCQHRVWAMWYQVI